MDAGPVTGGKSSASWKLAPEVAAKTQGLVVSGFGVLNFGRALFLQLGNSVASGAWLEVLAKVAPVTSAVPPAKDAMPTRATALALSWVALAAWDSTKPPLPLSPAPSAKACSRRTGCGGWATGAADKWLPTVVPGGPFVERQHAAARKHCGPARRLFDVRDGSDAEVHVTTSLSVHAVLLLYAATDQDAKDWCAAVESELKTVDVAIVRSRSLFIDAVGSTPASATSISALPTALSQPAPFDRKGAVTRDGTAVAEPDPVQGIPLGEVLFGYANGHDEPAPGPVVPAGAGRPAGHHRPPRPHEAGLEPASGRRGLFRPRPSTAAIWSCASSSRTSPPSGSPWTPMPAASGRRIPRTPGMSPPTGSRSGAVGRDRNGHLLCPDGVLAPVDGKPDNGYLFWERDRFGHGCPLGSHVRRANPRDALAPDEASRPSLLKAANNHRILRRGRKYGPPIANDRVGRRRRPGATCSSCLNTDIARQFEFIQQTWLLNTTFATLYHEQDPLIGAPGPMTVREKPLRRIVHVETYIQMVGGDYFFLPSLPALRYLARL